MLLQMIMRLYIAFVGFLSNVLESHSSAQPRLAFTVNDTRSRRIPLPHTLINDHIQLVEDGNGKVITKADQQLYYLDFETGTYNTYYGDKCEGADRNDAACSYTITVLHKRRGTRDVFMCESSSKNTKCCDLELSQSAECRPSPTLNEINKTVRDYGLKAGDRSLFIESPVDHTLYVAQSGTEDPIGLYKFGPARVRPTTPGGFALGLVVSKGKNKMEDMLYTFFKVKKTAGDLESGMWLPFVSQVCMSDTGGTKKQLLYQWTTELKAQLFCGDRATRRQYTELVDVAFLPEENGTVSRVYALFRNEWAMSAVCVYSIDHINNVFKTSPFKGNKDPIPSPRPGTCTQGQIQPDTQLKRLSLVQRHPEMAERVFSINETLLVSHHHYTLIRLHAVHTGSDRHILLYLSLENGKIHKVLESKTGAFIIAEYSPFRHRTQILDMVLSATEKKLYVSSRQEVVQVELQSCAEYGQYCMDCVLARDPYCGWGEAGCVGATSHTLQDVEKGNHYMCHSGKAVNVPEPHHIVPLHSRYFLQCPVSSLHAEYTWHRPGNATTPCRKPENGCDLLIDSFGPQDAGMYRCRADELGHTRTLVFVELKMKDEDEDEGLRKMDEDEGPMVNEDEGLNGGVRAASSTPRAWGCMVALVLGAWWL